MATRLLMATLLTSRASFAQPSQSPQTERAPAVSGRRTDLSQLAVSCSNNSHAHRSSGLPEFRRKVDQNMADAVGAIGAANAAQYAVAVTRKEHSQEDEQGRQAVQLIQAATAPELASSGTLGTKLNVLA
jgi:hypothetical protein